MLKTYLQPKSGHVIWMGVHSFTFRICAEIDVYRVSVSFDTKRLVDFIVPYTKDISKDIKEIEDYMLRHIENWLQHDKLI
jgi:hypothetical protein